MKNETKEEMIVRWKKIFEKTSHKDASVTMVNDIVKIVEELEGLSNVYEYSDYNFLINNTKINWDIITRVLVNYEFLSKHKKWVELNGNFVIVLFIKNLHERLTNSQDELTVEELKQMLPTVVKGNREFLVQTTGQAYPSGGNFYGNLHFSGGINKSLEILSFKKEDVGKAPLSWVEADYYIKYNDVNYILNYIIHDNVALKGATK